LLRYPCKQTASDMTHCTPWPVTRRQTRGTYGT
jgi:hypothetical protein